MLILRKYSISNVVVLMLALFFSSFLYLNSSSFVHAQEDPEFFEGSFGNTPNTTGTGNPGTTGTGNSGTTGTGNPGTTGTGNSGGGVTNPLSFNSIQAFFAKILEFLVLLGVPFIILMIIYTGFKFVTAQGNPEAIKTAQQMFLYTIIGGLLILGASIIASVIKGTVDDITLLDRTLQAAAPLFNF